ncbi:hypothetical protein GCM10011349_19180 [Novosphingobium indicum]|uniref:DUF465 domain-containing protein n=1 Tax=Novosphingobium indicum TaxID=462949 RepID=A0ABQ2JL32_9SPHN|nr:DUF465 domain-containing protein [Novosphingobium indicum]GGN49005.1 hypothetical protein GCM10011349_19180 [Novosphingobium indicum]|tara:strand:- start:924 stop:1175 length:252 start_codon:yes stop_codon:yes gene_type:complete
MSHKPHDLAAEFPEDVELLHRLKGKGHFAALSERYTEVNHAITRIEAELDAASDDRLEELKKERLSLLDRIAEVLREARHAQV